MRQNSQAVRSLTPSDPAPVLIIGPVVDESAAEPADFEAGDEFDSGLDLNLLQEAASTGDIQDIYNLLVSDATSQFECGASAGRFDDAPSYLQLLSEPAASHPQPQQHLPRPSSRACQLAGEMQHPHALPLACAVTLRYNSPTLPEMRAALPCKTWQGDTHVPAGRTWRGTGGGVEDGWLADDVATGGDPSLPNAASAAVAEANAALEVLWPQDGSDPLFADTVWRNSPAPPLLLPPQQEPSSLGLHSRNASLLSCRTGPGMVAVPSDADLDTFSQSGPMDSSTNKPPPRQPSSRPGSNANTTTTGRRRPSAQPDALTATGMDVPHVRTAVMGRMAGGGEEGNGDNGAPFDSRRPSLLLSPMSATAFSAELHKFDMSMDDAHEPLFDVLQDTVTQWDESSHVPSNARRVDRGQLLPTMQPPPRTSSSSVNVRGLGGRGHPSHAHAHPWQQQQSQSLPHYAHVLHGPPHHVAVQDQHLMLPKRPTSGCGANKKRSTSGGATDSGIDMHCHHHPPSGGPVNAYAITATSHEQSIGAFAQETGSDMWFGNQQPSSLHHQHGPSALSHPPPIGLVHARSGDWSRQLTQQQHVPPASHHLSAHVTPTGRIQRFRSQQALRDASPAATMGRVSSDANVPWQQQQQSVGRSGAHMATLEWDSCPVHLAQQHQQQPRPHWQQQQQQPVLLRASSQPMQSRPRANTWSHDQQFPDEGHATKTPAASVPRSQSAAAMSGHQYSHHSARGVQSAAAHHHGMVLVPAAYASGQEVPHHAVRPRPLARSLTSSSPQFAPLTQPSRDPRQQPPHMYQQQQQQQQPQVHAHRPPQAQVLQVHSQQPRPPPQLPHSTHNQAPVQNGTGHAGHTTHGGINPAGLQQVYQQPSHEGHTGGQPGSTQPGAPAGHRFLSVVESRVISLQ